MDTSFKMNLSIFFFPKVVLIYSYCWKTAKFMFLISDHVAIKYFPEIVEFKELVCPIFSFLKVVLVNKYGQEASYFLFLSLVMQQWNISIKFWNFRSFLMKLCSAETFLEPFLALKMHKPAIVCCSLSS